jgi:hypothetical protein
MYFGPQNSQAIDAMIGVASANWPDIVEAQTFNGEYGLYISAPPGASKAYPSHLGGFFIAANGVYKFYNVTNKEELLPDGESIPPYKVSIAPGYENEFDFTVTSSKIIITDPGFTNEDGIASSDGRIVLKKTAGSDAPALVLSGVPVKVVNKMFQIDYDESLNLAVGITKTAYREYDNGVWKYRADDTFPLDAITEVPHLDDNGDPVEGFVDIKFADFDLQVFLDGKSGSAPVVGGPNYTKFITGGGDSFAKLFELLQTGFAKFADGTKYKFGFALCDLIHIVANIQDEVYGFIMQKSMTEKKTNIVLSDISYDKYRYDAVFDYTKVVDWTSVPLPNSKSPEVMAFYIEGNPYPEIKIFSRIGSAGLLDEYYDDTDSYSTQYVTFAHPHDFDETDPEIEAENKDMYHKIYYVDENKLVHVNTEEECIAIEDGDSIRGIALYQVGLTSTPPTVAIKDPYFNTFTFSCTEEVYPGVNTNGGSFTGSFDEFGTDTYGSNIYFPNVLTDDDFSFVEVRVLKKFGDDTDDLDNGFWTHKRAIDPYDMDMYKGEVPQLSFAIEGDRYTNLLMEMNLIEGKTGGIWRPEHAEIIKAGLIEALNPEYDDAYIFIEPSGYENLKQYLSTIRKAQEFATVITPFLIPTSAISNGMVSSVGAQKLIVNGRYRGVSTWCGEFEVFDDITFKKYWRKPIGDVGLMLARIMDLKLGAWSPAWMNVGVVGGQLKSAVLRSKYGYDDSSLEDKLKVTYILDQKGINPIAFSSDDGLMMLSSKTTEDPNTLSNWSFLESQMSFDLVKREIRDNVMRQQIKKPINDYYMGIRQQQVDAILSKRLSGAQPLWYSATCDVKGVNTELTKKMRKFCIRVEVKPTIFAETVELTLSSSV